MNNQLVSEENISKTPPQWPRVNIPGNAVQGSILLTVNQFVEPPQDASNLKWLPMEDIIGTANVKMEYDEKLNLFNFYKAKGHLNNDKNWVYEWTLFATIAGISEDVQEELKNLIYVSYRYDTSIPNSLVVYGIKKDGVEELLCNINFVSSQEFAIAVNNLSTQITSEITRATNRENQIAGDLNNEITRATNRENQIADDLNNEITRATNRENQIAGDLNNEITRATNKENELHEEILDVFHQEPGTALDKTPIGNYGGRFNVLVDDDNIKVNNNNQLTTNVIDDTISRNDKTYSSSKIAQIVHQIGQYRGKVQTVADLPTQDVTNGDTYKVEADGNYYMWNGTTWDDLESDYIAGTGIDITNRVISATGIAFNVGDGLKTTGSGDETTLSADIGEGLDFYSNGKIKINTNFTEVTTPLGSDISNINKHSDGKISVNIGEALSGEIIINKASLNVGQIYYLPTGKQLNDYKWIQVGRLGAVQFFLIPTDNEFSIGIAMAGGSGANLGILTLKMTFNKTNNTYKLTGWGQYDTSSSSVSYISYSTQLDNITLVGIK